MRNYIFLILAISLLPAEKSDAQFRIGRLKYGGGGDWYNDPSAEINLLKFIQSNTNIRTTPEYVFVDVSSDEIFSFPFLFMTGHGNVVFSESEIRRLRVYLENGGFLYVDDDYGLDKAFRREISRIFPEIGLIELPYSYGLFNCYYRFPNGTPKIHEHDNKPPRTFGIFIDNRLAVLYTYETNPSDGWADPDVHKNPPHIREKALQFGTNIVLWALTN